MGDGGWYPEQGPTVDTTAADVREILDAAGANYLAEYKKGMTVTLLPTGPGHFNRGMWFVSFNPPDLYFPHQWFWEASGSDGMVFNRQVHGPQASTMFAEHLRFVNKPAEYRSLGSIRR